MAIFTNTSQYKNMKLEKLRIQNFRSFKDQTIEFDNYNVLVGPNGSGKSTVLTALNVLFRNTPGSPTDISTLDKEDFHNFNISDPVEITAQFGELSEGAQSDFSHYVRNGKLIISATAIWDPNSNSAIVKQYGSRLQIPEFAPYFDAEDSGESAKTLKSLYANIRMQFPDLPEESVKANMHTALVQYGEDNPSKCIEAPSEDQFYGWSRGANLLEKHIQWVYIPAVKDASGEQMESRNSALTKLLQRAVKTRSDLEQRLTTLKNDSLTEYQSILDDHQHKLQDLSSSLEVRLREWAHPGANIRLKWDQDTNRSVTVADPVARAFVGESNFSGDVLRLGHGLQRSFIITILHELAEIGGEDESKLLLAIEEPELYQHPPQARHFAGVLEGLTKGSIQVVSTTHSPLFLKGENFETVRLIRRPTIGGPSEVAWVSADTVRSRLQLALGQEQPPVPAFVATISQIMQPSLAEIFFCGMPVLVEGPEDIGAMTAYFVKRGWWPKARELDVHFIPCSGKTNMSRPIAILVGMNTPFYGVFDGDSNTTGQPECTIRDNDCILSLCGVPPLGALPESSFFGPRVTMWKDDIQTEIRDCVGVEAWAASVSDARDANGWAVGLKLKNALLMAAVVGDLVDRVGTIESFEKLGAQMGIA